jgi:ABC-type methionine transport system ATPase subunit
MTLDGVGRSDRVRRVRELLELVGLSHRADHRPDALSGGEQQRVAVAIALANDPKVLLADEPTGELDSQSSNDLFSTLREANRETGVTIVVLTHDPLVVEQVQRTILIRDGRTATETLRRHAVGPEGEEQLVAEELAVLDRTGRLQLPPDYVAALTLERRVRLALERDHISVWPQHATGGDGDDD